MVVVCVSLLHESSDWSSRWVKLWGEVEGLSFLLLSSGSSLSFLGGNWVFSFGSSLGISLDSFLLLLGLLGSLLSWFGGNGNILALLEGGNRWVKSSISKSLLEVFLLSLVDEESLFVVFLGILDRSSGLNSVVFLIIRVSKGVFDSWGNLGLNKWVEWLLHLSTGNFLSLLDRVVGGGNILIIGVGWWWHSSLLLLESGITIEILHVDLWWTKRAVNWVRLKLGSR